MKRPDSLFGLALVAGALTAGCDGAYQEPEEHAAGGASIMLRLPDSFGPLRRPAVAFDHDRHTRRLKGRCDRCHLERQGKLVYKFARQEDGPDRDADALMDLYHDRCVGCHREQNRDRGKAAPVACAQCHERTPPERSDRAVMAFDGSLHQRHVEALGKKCDRCHEGQPKGKEDTPPMMKAPHDGCLTCHRARAEGRKRSGPVDCAGCHGAARRRKYEQVKDVARLMSGQKDTIAIHTAGAVKGGVRFDHKGHEQTAGFCTTCHHWGKKPCGKCHTLTGSKEGGGVVLERAHHAPGSRKSCVGCHAGVTRSKDCAGCHRALPTPPAGGSCGRCHGQQAATADAGVAPLPPASDDFPEQVVIKALARKYQPSKLPHRKIMAALVAAVRKSKLARAMHGGIQTLCAGCHHGNWPPGQRPPSCRSCHDRQGDPTRDRPGLQAAYHRQCIGCHRQMGIKQQGCTDCHAAASKESSR